MTIGLVQGNCASLGWRAVEYRSINPGDKVKIGPFTVEFIHVNHSIAGTYALAVHTPVGIIVHTADFKIDYTPIDGDPTDLRKFTELGAQGCWRSCPTAPMEGEGFTPSERVLTEKFELSTRPKGGFWLPPLPRISIGFRQVINAAMAHGRKWPCPAGA